MMSTIQVTGLVLAISLGAVAPDLRAQERRWTDEPVIERLAGDDIPPSLVWQEVFLRVAALFYGDRESMARTSPRVALTPAEVAFVAEHTYGISAEDSLTFASVALRTLQRRLTLLAPFDEEVGQDSLWAGRANSIAPATLKPCASRWAVDVNCVRR
jgi:hypothetical protein